MIERIQTVFLFIAGVALTLVLFMPIWEKQNAETKEKVTLNALTLTYSKASKDTQTIQTFYIAIVSGIAALIAFYAIFQYKNRLFQIKLVLANTLVISSVLGLMFVFVTYFGETSFEKPLYGDFGIGFYLPAVALICNMVARRYIKRDEDLVRSADRMR